MFYIFSLKLFHLNKNINTFNIIIRYQQMDKIKIKAAVAPVRRTLAEMSQISNESSRQMDADINTMKHRIILDAELEKNITEERRRLQFNVDE